MAAVVALVAHPQVVLLPVVVHQAVVLLAVVLLVVRQVEEAAHLSSMLQVAVIVRVS